MNGVYEYGVTERPVYSYKLNENYKGGFPVSMNGITLQKGWNDFGSQQKDLLVYVRSYRNKEGLIDEKVIDSKNKIYVNTEEIYKTEKILYTREVLVSYPRQNLVDIARIWGIEPEFKVNKLLITLILEEQEKYKFYKEEERRKEKEKLKNSDFLVPFPTLPGL